MFLSYNRERNAFEASTETTIFLIFLFGFFLAGDTNLFGIDHHNKISRIQMWCIGRFVSTSEYISHLFSDSAENEPFSINNMPISFLFVYFW